MARNISIIFILTLVSFSTWGQSIPKKYDPANGFQIFLEVSNPKVELGPVKQGETRTFDYEFTNITDEDVVIELVSACTCTETNYPRRPIKPGETGKINVLFDSTEKEDSDTISVDVFFVNMDKKNETSGMQFLEYSYILEK